MRFIVDLQNFRTALAGCAKTVGKNDLREVLRYAHIKPVGSKPAILVEALDGYQLIEYTLAAEVEDVGDILVDPKLLLGKLPKNGRERIVIYDANGYVTVEDWHDSGKMTWIVSIPKPEGEYVKTENVWKANGADEYVDTIYNANLLANIVTLCQLDVKNGVQVSTAKNPLHPTIISSREENSATMRVRGMVFPVRP